MKRLEDKLSNEVIEEIKRMYLTDLHSIKDISRSFNELKISETGIKGLLKRAGIEIRTLSQSTSLSYQHHVHSGIGKKYSKERVEKVSQTRKAKGIKPACKFPKGHKPWNTGTKGLVTGGKGVLRPTITGENHYNWKGGYKNKLAHVRLRNHRRRCAIGSYSIDEWEALKFEYNLTCPACGKKEPVINLTIDHIKPLSKGGTNELSNIQPLCLSCNCRKNDKEIRYEVIKV